MIYPHVITWGFYTPAQMTAVFAGRQYQITGTVGDVEAQHDLYWFGLDWW